MFVIRLVLFLLALALLTPLAQAASDQEMRFPAPEFKSGYGFPETTTPLATSESQQWTDVAVLAITLSLATWLAVKRHSRRGVFWLMIFSLLYFGFFKEGCICPIGSIQNVALSLFNSHYALPVTVLIFFGLPLVFALFFGRVFCASVCALGAIQDLVAIKPIQLPRKVTIGLSVIPYAYLGLAVLLAATNTGFLICRYDPFIGFFRLTGNAPYLYLGAGFLLAGIVIARPYCRFFCPYGVLLGWMSRLSRWHLAITPTNCVNCRLCENSCPFDYIHKPNLGLARENRQTGVRRLGYLFLMLPVVVGHCGWVGHRLSVPLSRYNSTVALAEQVLAEKQDATLEPTLETKTFRSKGVTESELIQNALAIRAQLNLGGWLVGGFIGLVFGLKLIGFSTVRTQKDYEVDRTHCFSCARCCTYCPNDPGYRGNFVQAPPNAPEHSLAAPSPPQGGGKGRGEGISSHDTPVPSIQSSLRASLRHLFSVGRDAVPRVPDISLARWLNRNQTKGKPERGGVSIAPIPDACPHHGDIRDAVQRVPTTANTYSLLGEGVRISQRTRGTPPTPAPERVDQA